MLLSQNQIDSIVRLVLHKTIQNTKISVKSLTISFVYNDRNKSHIVDIELIDEDSYAEVEHSTYFQLYIQENFDMILYQVLNKEKYMLPLTNCMVIYAYIRDFVVSVR